MGRKTVLWLLISLVTAVVGHGFVRGQEIPLWSPDVAYQVGDLVRYEGILYRCRQAHTSQTDWTPPVTPALWERVEGTPEATATPTPAAFRLHLAQLWRQGAAQPSATPTPTGTSTPTPTPTATPGPSATPSATPPSGQDLPGFAPYVDVLLYPLFPLVQTVNDLGLRAYSLAFIVDGGDCQAAWGGVVSIEQDSSITGLASAIQQLQTRGVQVIVSFGGANGMELAQACPSVDALVAQYQAVIDRYHVKRVDFDIEGAAVADTASIQRRNQAIARLQAANPDLRVAYTLPVLPSGLTHHGTALLQNALDNGIRVDLVNVMAMDYGSVAPPDKMGQNAIDAANSTFQQLKSLYPERSDEALWRMIGVTPMIGLNDVTPEVFTLDDARLLAAFARQQPMGQLSMWSVSRDQSCPNGGSYVSPTCSGVAQEPFDFARIFLERGFEVTR